MKLITGKFDYARKVHYVKYNINGKQCGGDESSEKVKAKVFFFSDRSKAVLLLWIFYVFFCLVFAMPLCASVYMCLGSLEESQWT